MGDVGLVRAIGRGIAATLEPLVDAFSDPPARRELLIAAGLTPRDDVVDVPIDELEQTATRLRDFEDAAETLEAISALVVLLEQLVRLVAFVDDEDDFLEIGLRLLEICGASRIRQRRPVEWALMRLVGVLADDLLRIDWDRVGDVFSRLLVPRAPDAPPVPIEAALVQAWVVYASVLLAKGFGVDEIEWLYGWDPDPTIRDDPAQQISERTVTIALRERGLQDATSSDGVSAEALISVAFVPPEHNGPAIALGLGGALEIESGGEDVDPATSLPVRPPGTRVRVSAPAAATVLIPLGGSPEKLRVDGGGPGPVAFELRRPPSDTKLVFPDDTRRRWEIGSIAFAGGLVGNDLAFELTVGDAAIVIDPEPDPDTPADPDKPAEPAEPGAELLDGPTRIPFTFSVGWTDSRGLFISGGTALGITIATPWAKLGGLRFQHVRLELVPPGGEAGRALGVDATTSASLDIGGAFHATVDRIGVRLAVDFSDGTDLQADFIAPSGIGLRIDTKAVRGGGSLLLDRDRGEYAGVFEVTATLGETDLTLQALVIYTTKVQGADSALLASLSVQGFRWDLGWGFALTGVGGMIGANHGVDLPALREGLRTGALEHVMFPDDPVRNAARIFQTLRTVFPVQAGSTIAAFFLLLRWGTGDVARIRLGLLAQWGPGADDNQLVLLGSLDLGLPTIPRALARIKADLLGVVRWTDGLEISVDAHLRDSQVLGIALTGSLALRLRRNDKDSTFLLSVGGFHPQFPLPPASEVPRLDRLGFRLEKRNVRLSAEAYFAIASCTIQHGQRVDLVARGLGLRLEASVGFDVIVELDTGNFVAEFFARAALKRGSSTLMGVDLSCRLEGTTPYRISGTATFKIWFIKKSIRFDELLSGGEPQVARVDARALLVAELAQPRNWSGATPPAGRRLVSIDPVAHGEDVAVVHPLAQLGVRQRLLPLELELDRVGGARPSGERRFEITRLSGLGDGIALDGVSDQFAAAQFLDLDEAAVLSQPGFERLPAGVRARSAVISVGTARRRPLVHETIVIPTDHRPAARPPRPPRPPRGGFGELAQFWTTASTRRTVAREPASGPERRVELRAEAYAIVGADLSAVGGAARRSFHLARQELAGDGAPVDAAVVEAHEVRA